MTSPCDRAGRRSNAASGIAAGLKLAAAPTFAAMALAQAAADGHAMGLMCMSRPGASVLTGMVAMYGLMSLFHLSPWLRLLLPPRGSAIASPAAVDDNPGQCLEMRKPPASRQRM